MAVDRNEKFNSNNKDVEKVKKPKVILKFEFTTDDLVNLIYDKIGLKVDNNDEELLLVFKNYDFKRKEERFKKLLNDSLTEYIDNYINGRINKN